MLSRKSQSIHFIGIGGIGVSALARHYLAKGWKVSGSDLASSEITKALKKLGVRVFIGPHSARFLRKDVGLAVRSPAVGRDNPELKEAERKGLKILSYPQALGDLTRKHFTIAVSGTHGKSTTTAMLGILMVKAGLDPTVIVGTKVREFGNSNYRAGKSKYLLIEADEHFASFLNYKPRAIVLTSIEPDHLDYYKNLDNLLRAFKKYVGLLPKDGVLAANKDDENIKRIVSGRKVKWFSLAQQEAKKLQKMLKVPGSHNVSNGLAALAAARILGIPDKTSFKALSEYKGSWRRFEEKKARGGLVFISDYGHHPTEVKVTLKAVREKYPKKRIWCVFQPHQYQRTHYLFSDFVDVFKKADNIDRIIITDIYDVAGREEKRIKRQVSAERLVEAVKKENVVCVSQKRLISYLKGRLSNFDVLLVMGAGNIYETGERFLDTIKGR